MSFDFENPHTWYVVAAYSVAAIGYGALIIHTAMKWCTLNKEVRKLEKNK